MKSHHLRTVLLALLSVGHAVETEAGDPAPAVRGQRVFITAHSFHNFVGPRLQPLAAAAGIEGHELVGVQMIGASQVIQHWNLPDDKNRAKAALATGKVDVLTMSPKREMPDEGIDRFVDFGLDHNPGLRVFVQESWVPFDGWLGEAPIKANEERDTRPLDVVREANRRFKEAIESQARALNKRHGREAVFVVPVGDAVLKLRELVAAGKVPGVTKSSELFTDAIGHGRPPVMALATYCNFACIYRRSPAGLNDPQPELDRLSPGLRPLLQRLAWEAVAAHPMSGVAAADKPDSAAELPGAVPFTDENLFTSGIEGPACDREGNIYAVNFSEEGTIGRVTPAGKAELFVKLPAGSTGNGIRFGGDGLMYVADYTGHNVLRVAMDTRAVTVFAHEPGMNQPNDLAVTADGVLYASDPDWKSGTGRLWRIGRDGGVVRVADAMGTTNGIDVSPDGRTLYVNESVQRNVWAFSIAPDGGLSDKRLLRRFPDHGFDGMRCDVEGNLYVTRHGKGTVVKLSPAGEILKEIEIPGTKPSNLCFGGPDGRTVYVTEVDHRRLVRFRVDQPGLEWARAHAPRIVVEASPPRIERVVAAEGVCAWPNLTRLRDGTIVAIIHNRPSHGGMEGDVECWASADGLKWEKRSTVTRHEPDTVRMNAAAGLAGNGDLIVLCSGWTNAKQPGRPKQAAFRDDILRPWVLRSGDGGRTWTMRVEFPAPEEGWSEQIPFGDIWAGEDGALHTSCYQGKHADPAKSAKTSGYRAWHFRSDDDGATWKATSLISPKHNETDIFPLGGRRWLAAARAEAMDLFVSGDDGATWQGPRRVTGRNEINGHLARLKDGRLLLSYGVRIRDRHGVCAKLSADEGKTWGGALRLARSDEGDCGYPSSVQRADGRIVTAYYSKRAPECDRYHMGVAIWTPPGPP